MHARRRSAACAGLRRVAAAAWAHARSCSVCLPRRRCCLRRRRRLLCLQVYDEVVRELKLRGAYIMNKEQVKAAGSTIIKDGRLNADVVGQKATALARLFGFEVPPSTKVLIGEVDKIGKEEPMSYEKLCPTLGERRAVLWRAAPAAGSGQAGGPPACAVRDAGAR